MAEHQYTQQSKKTDKTFQKQTIPPKQIPTSHPAAIIQHARINPKSLTHADVIQLQRTIGNRAVGKLLTEIGLPSKTTQAQPVQMQPIPEVEEVPLQGKFAKAIQRQEIPEEEVPLQGKFAKALQRQEIPEEEEPLQGKFENEPEQVPCPSCSMFPIQQKKENRTGMPDNLKAGVESLSGIDMSDVRVHYNSDKPAEVGAMAYTKSSEIHVAPGQERNLPHEAWHVVQQVQGRVRPTTQMKGVAVNEEEGLEREADYMASRVVQKEISFENKARLYSRSKSFGQKKSNKMLKSRICIKQPRIYQKKVDSSVRVIQLQPFKTREEEKIEHKRLIKNIDTRIADLKKRRYNIEQELEKLESGTSNNPYRSTNTKKNKHLVKRKKALQVKMDGLTEQVKKLQDKRKSLIQSSREDVLDKQAELWSKMASSKESEQILYLGSGVEDVNKLLITEGKDKIEPHILNVSSEGWSEGVNEAWMRGGEENNAKFITLTQLSPEARSLIYESYRKSLSAEEFLTIVGLKLRKDRHLWHLAENRPTYYAKEIAHLIDNGYVLSHPSKTDDPTLSTPAHFGKSLPRTLGRDFKAELAEKSKEITDRFTDPFGKPSTYQNTSANKRKSKRRKKMEAMMSPKDRLKLQKAEQVREEKKQERLQKEVESKLQEETDKRDWIAHLAPAEWRTREVEILKNTLVPAPTGSRLKRLARLAKQNRWPTTWIESEHKSFVYER
jgi:hypothetical protein